MLCGERESDPALLEVSMKITITTLVFLAAAWVNAGCSSKAFYGGMIGAGVGGMIDQMEEEEEEKPK
jgi:hypothetical protein